MHKPNSPEVSFIVVSWNNRDLLDECFASIYSQSFKSFNVILVDNGSTDETMTFVKKNYPQIIIVETGKNLGFAIANNLGITNAFKNPTCRYVALLNTDARIAKDWLKSLVSFAENHPHGASFQSPTFDYYDQGVLDSRGISIDHKGRAVQLGYREPVGNLVTTNVFGVNAAAALYSRTFLEEQPFGTDYFDSDLWMYLEDVDLAARATVMGWENWFVNKSEAYHMGSASSSKNPGLSVYMIYRNNSLMLLKNLPIGVLLKITPGVLTTDLATLWKLFKDKNYATMKAILKGRLYSLPLLFRFIPKRRMLKKHRRISTKLLWKQMGVK